MSKFLYSDSRVSLFSCYYIDKFFSLLEFNEVNFYSAAEHEEQCSPSHSVATQSSLRPNNLLRNYHCNFKNKSADLFWTTLGLSHSIPQANRIGPNWKSYLLFAIEKNCLQGHAFNSIPGIIWQLHSNMVWQIYVTQNNFKIFSCKTPN